MINNDIDLDDSQSSDIYIEQSYIYKNIDENIILQSKQSKKKSSKLSIIDKNLDNPITFTESEQKNLSFIYKKKDNMFCNNCGKYGHFYKKCYDPQTSYGIICLKISDEKIINFLKTKYQLNNNQIQDDVNESPILFKRNEKPYFKYICLYKYIQKNINCNNKIYLETYTNKISKDIEYLFIRRKYTYNYVYLIRGIYSLDIENIINSINLLTHDEYHNILNLSFEELWKDIWGEHINKKEFINNYNKAKEQFMFLKKNILPQIKHRINITYNEPEWGFPKGKRNDGETNLECAKREFEEESGLNSDDYTILTKLYPIIENVYGTNKINYRYYYYIALLSNNFDTKNLKIKENSIQSFEIGDIKLSTANNIDIIFRKYNYDRIKIIEDLKLFLIYNIRYFEKFYYINN